MYFNISAVPFLPVLFVTPSPSPPHLWILFGGVMFPSSALLLLRPVFLTRDGWGLEFSVHLWDQTPFFPDRPLNQIFKSKTGNSGWWIWCKEGAEKWRFQPRYDASKYKFEKQSSKFNSWVSRRSRKNYGQKCLILWICNFRKIS